MDAPTDGYALQMIRHHLGSTDELEVPAPEEPATPVAPPEPPTPIDPDPGSPADPGQPPAVPPPVEPADPIAPEEAVAPQTAVSCDLSDPGRLRCAAVADEPHRRGDRPPGGGARRMPGDLLQLGRASRAPLPPPELSSL
jgi:hypothetical protein